MIIVILGLLLPLFLLLGVFGTVSLISGHISFSLPHRPRSNALVPAANVCQCSHPRSFHDDTEGCNHLLQDPKTGEYLVMVCPCKVYISSMVMEIPEGNNVAKPGPELNPLDRKAITS
jgi:hypothetical protein